MKITQGAESLTKIIRKPVMNDKVPDEDLEHQKALEEWWLQQDQDDEFIEGQLNGHD